VLWTLALTAACVVKDSARRAGNRPGDEKSWAPESVATVSQVPLDSVRGTIDRRLKGGRPKELDADRGHTSETLSFYAVASVVGGGTGDRHRSIPAALIAGDHSSPAVTRCRSIAMQWITLSRTPRVLRSDQAADPRSSWPRRMCS